MAGVGTYIDPGWGGRGGGKRERERRQEEGENVRLEEKFL